jgi:uncharacterized protein YqeY
MLKQKIQEDMTSAMKAKEEMKLSVIRMLKSAVQYYEINKGGAGYEATDEDVIDVIGKEIKKRKLKKDKIEFTNHTHGIDNLYSKIHQNLK